MPTPIVFLDFDGVLNTPAYCETPERNEHDLLMPRDADRLLDPAKVELLNQLVERAGAVVVLSTSWRTFYPVEDCVRFLRNRGFRGEFVGRTPRLSGWNDDGPQTRGHEILAWLKEQPAVPPWVAIDDLAQEYMVPVRGPRFIQTDENLGLTPELVERAVEMLRTPCS